VARERARYYLNVADGVTLTYEGVTEPLFLDLDLVTALGLVVVEIISNAYIHAFPGRAGAIEVILARSVAGASLTICDDGVGFVERSSNKRHGLGLVRRLMEQIGGSTRGLESRDGMDARSSKRRVQAQSGLAIPKSLAVRLPTNLPPRGLCGRAGGHDSGSCAVLTRLIGWEELPS
jgi:two-component sensor histidine kinase